MVLKGMAALKDDLKKKDIEIQEGKKNEERLKEKFKQLSVTIKGKNEELREHKQETKRESEKMKDQVSKLKKEIEENKN